MVQVPVSGKVIDEADRANLRKACDEMWLTEGHFTDEFERALELKFGRRFAIMCNSGSSANLLALAALELPKGSEVITCAVSFPTTVNPIIQLGLTPVFVDCERGTWNIDTKKLEDALSPRTRAVMVAHTLGNPVNMAFLKSFTQAHPLRVIFDCCDAAGATYEGLSVLGWGHLTTLSFYPAHQITTGEGGAVLTDDPKLAKIAESYRDWGRDCWCPPGHDNTCGKRYAGDYDHKYTYSRIGYNLKSTDLQASVGLSQLSKLDKFVQQRRENWEYLRGGLTDLPLWLPHATPNSEPSWFGFAFGTDRRNELARYLDAHQVGNRPLFAGNITRQPAYRHTKFVISGKLTNADYVHDNVIWIGCWPGLTKEQLDYSVEVIRAFYK